jgi:hypothetical protein
MVMPTTSKSFIPDSQDCGTLRMRAERINQNPFEQGKLRS